METAQRLGREFTKEQAVVVGQAAQLPNTKLGSDLGDSRHRRVSVFECSPKLMECSKLQTIQILLGHRDLEETTIYLHLSQRHLNATASPLDSLKLKDWSPQEE
jgi:hypothetical protein